MTSFAPNYPRYSFSRQTIKHTSHVSACRRPRTRLGPYEIAAQIGVGGMGEAYRAKDTKLGREVALGAEANSNNLRKCARR